MRNLPEPFTMIPVFINGPTYTGKAVIMLESVSGAGCCVSFNAKVEESGVHWTGSEEIVHMGVDSTPLPPEQYSYFSEIMQKYPHVSGGEEYEKVKELFEALKKTAWKKRNAK